MNNFTVSLDAGISLGIGAFFLAAGLGLPVLPRNIRQGRYALIYKICGALILVATVAQIIIANAGGESPARKLADAINQKKSFPVAIDKITTFTGVNAEGNTLVYNYKISMELDETTIGTMRGGVVAKACKNPMIAKIFQGKVAEMVFRYTMPDKQSFEQHVTPAACAQMKE